MTTMHTYKQIK